jgi:hypothetical protein
MNVCTYCNTEILPGRPFTVFEYRKYHLSCFAKYETKLQSEHVEQILEVRKQGGEQAVSHVSIDSHVSMIRSKKEAKELDRKIKEDFPKRKRIAL